MEFPVERINPNTAKASVSDQPHNGQLGKSRFSLPINDTLAAIVVENRFAFPFLEAQGAGVNHDRFSRCECELFGFDPVAKTSELNRISRVQHARLSSGLRRHTT